MQTAHTLFEVVDVHLVDFDEMFAHLAFEVFTHALRASDVVLLDC